MRIAAVPLLAASLLATVALPALAEGVSGAGARPVAVSSAPSRDARSGGAIRDAAASDAPRLVTLLPGLALAVDSEEELFYADGQFWSRRDGAWSRSLHPRASFVRVGPERVPAVLRELPPPPAAGVEQL